MPKLKECFDIGVGPFALTTGMPWGNLLRDGELDALYLLRSGKKPASSFYEIADGLPLDQDSLFLVQKWIKALYLKKWQKLYATMSLEYAPIENYSMIETHQGTVNNNGTLNRTSNNGVTTKNQSDGKTQNETGVRGTETEKPNEKIAVNNDIYAFDSEGAVKNTLQNTSRTGTSENKTQTDTTSTTTEVNNGTQVVTATDTDNTTSNSVETNTYTLTRKGNIGVTTSQQMIQSERELWLWNFFEVVFQDLDKILTLSVY